MCVGVGEIKKKGEPVHANAKNSKLALNVVTLKEKVKYYKMFLRKLKYS